MPGRIAESHHRRLALNSFIRTLISYRFRNCSLFGTDALVVVPDSGDSTGLSIEIAEKVGVHIHILVEGKPLDLIRKHVGHNIIEVANPGKKLTEYVQSHLQAYEAMEHRLIIYEKERGFISHHQHSIL